MCGYFVVERNRFALVFGSTLVAYVFECVCGCGRSSHVREPSTRVRSVGAQRGQRVLFRIKVRVRARVGTVVLKSRWLD